MFVLLQIILLLINSLIKQVLLHENIFIMVVIKCSIQECSYQTPDESCELVCRLLDLQKVDHENNSGSSQRVSMLNEPKLIWPRMGP